MQVKIQSNETYEEVINEELISLKYSYKESQKRAKQLQNMIKILSQKFDNQIYYLGNIVQQFIVRIICIISSNSCNSQKIGSLLDDLINKIKQRSIFTQKYQNIMLKLQNTITILREQYQIVQQQIKINSNENEQYLYQYYINKLIKQNQALKKQNQKFNSQLNQSIFYSQYLSFQNKYLQIKLKKIKEDFCQITNQQNQINKITNDTDELKLEKIEKKINLLQLKKKQLNKIKKIINLNLNKTVYQIKFEESQSNNLIKNCKKK